MENKLLIEPVFLNQDAFSQLKRWAKSVVRLPKKSCLPIQGKIFKYGVTITNIGNSVLEGALVKNVKIASASQMNFFHDTKREFSLNNLNPQAKIEIIFDEISSDLSGTAWISMDIVPRQAETNIITYQKIGNSAEHEFGVKNAWGDSFLIGSRFDASQERTNFLILVLTILTFVDGIWGLRVAAVWILSGVKAVLEFFVFIINSFT